MSVKSKKIMALTSVLAIFLLVADQWLKFLARSLWQARSVPLLGDWLSLHYQANQGLAFSLPLNNWLILALISLIILILAIFCLKSWRQEQFKLAVPLTIITISAISNLLDRVIYGSVIDYFYLKHFAIFNLADSAICLSVTCVIFLNLVKFKKMNNYV